MLWGPKWEGGGAGCLGQIGHESGQLLFLRERGGSSYLAKYDTGRLAARLGNTPEADGDGQRYAGRGLIHLTGLRNYRLCSEALGIDFVSQPQLLEQPNHAAMSAAWYWAVNGLNTLADNREFETITLIITVSATATWQIQDWRYGQQLQTIASRQADTLAKQANTALDQQRKSQQQRLQLERQIQAQDEIHYKELTDVNTRQARLHLTPRMLNELSASPRTVTGD
ncbi:prophage PSPPH02 chitinase [Pseudomonas sp. StFLB209]|nr:prophage PSPPH02 chitinase [Pseudomonas sp. StFLB209]